MSVITTLCTVPSHFSQSPARGSRSMSITSSHNIFTNTISTLFPLQSGFRASHSTQTLLLHCPHKWYKALDNKMYVGVVFLRFPRPSTQSTMSFFCPNLSTLLLHYFLVLIFNCSQVTCVLNSYLSWAFHLPGSPRAPSLAPLFFLLSSMTFPMFFSSTQLFSLLMIQPCILLITKSAVFNLLFKSVSTRQTCGSKEVV